MDTPPIAAPVSNHTQLWGKLLFAVLAVGVAIALSSITIPPTPQVSVADGSVVGMRFTDEGSQLLAIDPATLTVEVLGEAGNGVLKNRFSVPVPDGTISVDATGIIRTTNSGKITLVATAAVPRDRTPIAVTPSGDMVAWVAPADRSLQIFKKADTGLYVPIHLGPKSQVSSLAFTGDGTYLVTTSAIEGGVELRALNLRTGASTTIATSTDLILVTNDYE